MQTAVQFRDPKMNALESRFALEYLKPLLLAGEIRWFEFEPMRFRLGGSAFYKPDFVVIDGIGQVLSYETKGHWREAARARIKIAAERFPWVRFVAVKHTRGTGWTFEDFGPGP